MEAAVGCWSVVESQFMDALPQLASFRDFCGAASPSEAEVYVTGKLAPLPADGDAYTPEELADQKFHAIVSSDSEAGLTLSRITLDAFESAGNVVLLLDRHLGLVDMYDEATVQLSLMAHDRWMKNRVVSIVGEMAQHFLEHGGPIIRQVEFIGPFYNPKESWAVEGMWQGVELKIGWADYGSE